MKRILFLFFLTLLLCSADTEDKRTPLDVARSIAGRIMKDTSLELKQVVQKEQIDIQVINFRNISGKNVHGISYALSSIISADFRKLKYGLSFNTPVKIWINDNLVFENGSDTKFIFREIAYAIFEFQDTIEVELKKGQNKILIKNYGDGTKGKIYFREITNAEAPVSSKFVNPFNKEGGVWVYVGNFAGNHKNTIDEKFPPENKIDSCYNFNNTVYKWQTHEPNILNELVIKDDAVYKRESYAEWMYPNGTVLSALDNLANTSDQNSYSDFVKNVCDFTVKNYDLFQKQYYELDGFRSTNHRLYRMGMLDDASAPALPFIQLMLQKKGDDYKEIVDRVVDYVSSGQARLNDGTLCRPEPVKMTVWADDLFMAVPFLVRTAELKNEPDYYDDAAKQIINFNKYLFDSKINLYKHAWFDFSKEKSVAFWGRANGWIVWAVSEALLYLPAFQKDYNTIQKLFRKHIDGIVKVQNLDGMWNQVLDKKDSFKETSCTAMFIIGLTRGIRNGWIDKEYEKNLMLAWNALKERISKEGIVKDITRGTGIGYDLDFYFKRQRFDNDPRGLGAVIMAAVEMEKYLNGK